MAASGPQHVKWCPQCRQPLVEEGPGCPRCGNALVPLDVAHTKPKWYYSVWCVLGILFFVLGPFGIPLLWKSPNFTKGWKIGLTAAVALYTVWIVVATLQATQSVLGHLGDFERSLSVY